MITDDYRDIEAAYIKRRENSTKEAGKEDDGDSGSKDDGDSGNKDDGGALKRSFSSQTLMSLQSARREVSQLLEEFRSEDLTFESARVVVLDVRLRLDMAFFVLEENGIRSAPIYDHSVQQYVGFLTFSDLIDALLYFHNSSKGGARYEGFKCFTIKSWREFCNRVEDSWNSFINADASLYEACCMLHERRVHRLPVFARKSNLVVDVLTHARILRFIHEIIRSVRSRFFHGPSFSDLFGATVRDLGIGSYADLRTVMFSSTVAEALTVFSERNLSCLPVVDERGRIVDIYTRIDVSQFCLDGFNIDLSMPIAEAIQKYRRTPKGPQLCTVSATLGEVFDQFNATGVHRLYCVDIEDCLVGVISLGDVFKSFLYLGR